MLFFSRRPKPVSKFSVLLISTGLFILVWVSYPIISFNIFYASKFETIIRPVPQDQKSTSILIKDDNLINVLGTMKTDFTKASAWFPKAVKNISFGQNKSNYYRLTIPRLKIENASVVIEGEDLTKNLIQFTGPPPGNYGNIVIFGHSSLPFIYNPRDYKTIFTKLPDLKIDDDILVTIDNITYKYKVTDLKVTTPDDLSVLTQEYDNAYLTLITCVPPGTSYKRLIIKSKLSTA